jgi:hypothetical protein
MMNKKMNLLKCACCIIGMCCVFISCKEKTDCTDDPNLTSDELTWINAYTNGQIVIFKSDTGSYDTATVSKYFTLYGPTGDSKGCLHYYQTGIVALQNFKYNNMLAIFVSHYNQWYPKNLNSERINNNLGLGGNCLYNDVPQDSVVVNGITYNNIYLLAGLSGPAFVDYTKQNGIVEFDDFNGHQWVKIN